MELESLIHTFTELYIDKFFVDKLEQRDYDIINISIFNYHNSYYFNNAFKHIELGTDLTDNRIIIRDTCQKSIYDADTIRDDRYYSNTQPIDTSDIVELQSDLTFFTETLTEHSDLFSKVFEENDIKKLINLKNRHEITISEIEISPSNQDINSVLSHFHRVDKNYTVSNLIENYGFNYLKNITNDMPTRLYIAHNDYEIAGIMQLGDSLFIDDLNYLHKENFKYIKSVEVANSFRGQNLGIQLYKKALETNETNQEILINSRYTKDGSVFLENKVLDLSKAYKGIFILENEKQDYAYSAIEEIFKDDQDYNDGFKRFNQIIREERQKVITSTYPKIASKKPSPY